MGSQTSSSSGGLEGPLPPHPNPGQCNSYSLRQEDPGEEESEMEAKGRASSCQLHVFTLLASTRDLPAQGGYSSLVKGTR